MVKDGKRGRKTLYVTHVAPKGDTGAKCRMHLMYHTRTAGDIVAKCRVLDMSYTCRDVEAGALPRPAPRTSRGPGGPA